MSEPNSKSSKHDVTPTIAERALEKQTEVPQNASVYDFLYHDARRIASFLSQLHTHGVLQSVKATENDEQVSSTKSSGTAGIDFVTLAKGGLAVEGLVSTTTKDGAEHVYDAQWKTATTLLDFLAERELIVRDLQTARMGQFVIVSGKFAAFDVGILRELWKLSSVKTLIRQGASPAAAPPGKHDRRRDSAKSAAAPTELDVALEMIPLLPHSVQGSIRSKAGTAWFNLREESMVVSAAELILKHGISVPGEWSVLGILDAEPQDGALSGEMFSLEQADASLSLGGAGGVVSSMGQLAAMTRLFLGRPLDTYGLTPVMIFREVAASV